MAQTAKFIDVTNTFVPVDPNAFPETLHLPSQESSPEDKVDSVAYKGYNFLPTAHGYKSYFGINQNVGIDAIPARVDDVFIYQNNSYENILIALTDLGIYIKIGSASGAWTQEVVRDPEVNPSVTYQWTHVVIADILYIYRQGDASYYKVESDAILGVIVTEVTPNFLNMAAQVGLFRAAGRLAFWDSSDSVGWANLSDFSDFTPSLETLAGNAVFTDIQGRIVTIKSHGPGFILYATKSVVYIAQDTANVFQWRPTVILPNSGISYPRQVALASPDSIHFAYTSDGLKKIDYAKETTIVPEVTDYLKEYTQPIYLKVLEGRYLFLELLDPTYVTGVVQFTDEVVPEVNYEFPGVDIDIAYGTPADPIGSTCATMEGITSGKFQMGQPADPVDIKPGTRLTPVWTCYLSRNGVEDAGAIDWTAAPCPTIGPDGIEANMKPSGAVLGDLTTDDTNKVAVTGAEAYVDGIWTMERFMQAQSAIWKMEADAREAYLAAIVNRARIVTTTGWSATDISQPTARDECLLGVYPAEFTEPEFGYSSCSFWLTRYATKALDLIRVKATSISASPAGTIYSWKAFVGAAVSVESESAARAMVMSYATNPANAYAWVSSLPGETTTTYTGSVVTTSYWPDGTLHMDYLESTRLSDGYIEVYYYVLSSVVSEGGFNTSSSMYAYNKGEDSNITPVPETAYCEITGWTYTKDDDTTGTVASTECTAFPSYPENSTEARVVPINSGTNPPINQEDGSLCGYDYLTPLSGTIPVEWPTTIVTIPEGGFFLQVGSIAPVYPTVEGALVYDLQLKKWGKMKQRYKQLIDYSPINSALNGVIPVTTFGIMGGILGSDGLIYLFDRYPTDSYITYGKIGYYRLGKTSPEEVTVHFRVPSTGFVIVDTSLEGKNLSAGFRKQQEFTDATKCTLYGAYPGRWANITIKGLYDISYLEYRGFTQGRR